MMNFSVTLKRLKFLLSIDVGSLPFSQNYPITCTEIIVIVFTNSLTSKS